MGRPAKHSVDDFIDAAVALFASDGIQAVTHSAVAQSIGAANGSIYHRFPDRPSLLAAIWFRTLERFMDGFREKLGDPSVDSAIETAAWVVEWCGTNLAEAQVLQAGARAFGRADWSEEARERALGNDDIRQTVTAVVRKLQTSTAASPDEIAFVVMELPVAVVRRPLQAGEAPGAREADLVRGIAERVLRQGRSVWVGPSSVPVAEARAHD